jgi:hypothetical protein
MSPDLATYLGYRFPAEVIGHAAWLYHVFGLSLRDVELILAERGITVTQESIRQWCLRFGADFAWRGPLTRSLARAPWWGLARSRPYGPEVRAGDAWSTATASYISAQLS